MHPMKTLPISLFLALAACGNDQPLEVADAGLADAARPDSGPGDAGAADAGEPFERCGLLANGGAESGDLHGWTVESGDFKAAGASGSTPSPTEGSWLFFAGAAPVSRMYQDVDVSALGARIDAGGAVAHLSGMLRDWERLDVASMALEARGALGEPLTAIAAPGFAHDVWTDRRVGLALPAGTRTVRVALAGERFSGSDNDAYFDALELCVSDRPADGDDELSIAPYMTWLIGGAVSVSWEAPSPLDTRIAWGPTPALGLSSPGAGQGGHQKVRLAGLQPGTEYFFRVEGTRAPGALHSFRTPPAGDAPVSFVVWGDSQHGTDVFTPLARRMAGFAPQLAFAVGDVVSSGSDQNFDHQLLLPYAALRDVPLAVAPGNHDAYDQPNLSSFDLHLPQVGHCGGMRHGLVYFLRLDTNAPLPGGANQTCLDEALASADFAAATYRVVLFHEPPRIEYWAGGLAEPGTVWVRELLEPQLIAAGFDLAITGHSHAYTYGPPQLTGGLTWVTTGGGGGGLEPEDSRVADWPEITVVHLRHHFLHAVAGENGLRVSAIADTGEVLHSFDIAP